MKLTRILKPWNGLALALALTVAPWLTAQDTPPESGAQPAAMAGATPDEPNASGADDKSELRRLDVAVADAVESTALQEDAPPADDDAAVEADSTSAAKSATLDQNGVAIRVGSDRHRGQEGVFRFNNDLLVEADETVGGGVAILGNVIIDGRSDEEAVAILGDMTINGSGGGDTVAVLGNVTINGEVSGNVVAVLGRVQLGPNAKVHGQVVSVGGRVIKGPGVKVDGSIQEVAFMGDQEINLDWFKAWVRHCLLLGRPLGIGEHLGWAWMIAGSALLCYLLLALMLPGSVTRCAETMEVKPGLTIVAALLTMLIAPILGIVLSVTVIGPFVLALVMIAVAIFGKAVFLAWLGRRVIKPMGITVPVLAVLVGGILTLGFYLIPMVGFVFMKLSSLLGTGMVVYTIMLSIQADRAARQPKTTVRATAGMPFAETPHSGSGVAGMTSGSAGESTEPPPLTGAFVGGKPAMDSLQMAALPRAGFWVRIGATLLDVVLVAVFLNIVNAGDFFLLAMAVYCTAFWATKGTTIGGVVCGLKVVRLDARPVDWSVAVIRCLGGFLSLFVMGFGFIWVAFDADRQSWHDKIAGTTIVHVPKGVSLL